MVTMDTEQSEQVVPGILSPDEMIRFLAKDPEGSLWEARLAERCCRSGVPPSPCVWKHAPAYGLSLLCH